MWYIKILQELCAHDPTTITVEGFANYEKTVVHCRFCGKVFPGTEKIYT